MARLLIVGCFGAAALLSGCAQTEWQRPDATPQDLAADSVACNQYVASDGDSATIDVRLRGEHRYAAKRLLAKHSATHSDHHAAGHSHGSGSSGKGEAIAEGVLLLAAIVGTAAEDAQMYNDCMMALGWSPGQGATGPILASNSPAGIATDERIEEADLEDGAPSNAVPELGVTSKQLTPALARQLNLSGTRGVLIVDVVPSSPGDERGLTKGDVALSYEGRPIVSVADLVSAINISGDQMQGTLTVWRAGEEVVLY